MPLDRPSLDDAVTIKPDVVFRELSGEGVLLDLASGPYVGLDETSTRLWQLICQRDVLRRVFEDMLAEFDLDPERLQQDLLNFVADLNRRSLVSVSCVSAGS